MMKEKNSVRSYVRAKVLIDQKILHGTRQLEIDELNFQVISKFQNAIAMPSRIFHSELSRQIIIGNRFVVWNAIRLPQATNLKGQGLKF